jgi:hypothetical protein
VRHDWLCLEFAIEKPTTKLQNITDEGGDAGLDLATLAKLSADVVALRKGDHSAQRLELERARAAVAERDAEMRWKRKIVVGLEALEREIRKTPEANAAFRTLYDLLRCPFDPTESE